MSTFSEVRLRDVGRWVSQNFRIRDTPAIIGRAVEAYRAKYITCKNARLTPFFHCVAFCVVVNYAIEYNHLKKHDRMRKYH